MFCKHSTTLEPSKQRRVEITMDRCENEEVQEAQGSVLLSTVYGVRRMGLTAHGID